MRVFRIRQFVGQAEFIHVVGRNVLAVGGILRQAIVIDFHAEEVVWVHKKFLSFRGMTASPQPCRALI